MTAPNRRIRIVAWAIIVTHAIGVVANGFGLFTGDPAYTPALWMTFMVLKALGVVAGVLMLRNQRVGVWLFAALLAVGLVVALAFTGPHPLGYLAFAGGLLVLVGGGMWFALRGQWDVAPPARSAAQ